MAELVGSIAKYLNVKETNIDNLVFKLFYKFTFILFFASSVLLHLTQFFGDPINCSFSGKTSNFADDYCWIHGSPVFSYEYANDNERGTIGCIISKPEDYLSSELGPKGDPEDHTTSYYQWVSFVLLIQAGSFVLPYKAWKMAEGGLIKSFGREGKLKVMLGDDQEHIEGVLKTKALEKFVYYFMSTRHHNTTYFIKFVGCEFLNFVILNINFSLTNIFLNGKFETYGLDCLNYYRLSREEQKFSPNPFCSVFPTEVNCNWKDVGAAGGMQNHNGLCILSQNIINQKVYLLLWFWLVFLFLVSSLHFVFRLCTLFSHKLKCVLLELRCNSRKKSKTRSTIKEVMMQCYLGDWFLLHQLSKNVNGHFFHAFLEELEKHLPASNGKSGIV